jgi:hypothetical protein
MPDESPPGAPSIRRGNGRGKLRLLTRDDLDGRTRARKHFDTIATGIIADLGGEDRLTTIQRLLIEALAGCSLTLADINTRAMRGEPVDLVAYTTAVSSLVRIISRLPAGRVARDVTPSVKDYLKHVEAAE